MQKEKTEIVSFRVSKEVFDEIEEQAKLEAFDRRSDFVKDTFLPAFRARRSRTENKSPDPAFSC
jgi:Arc/MetJ-type ribon-helix-helix transcriptional regulator